MNTAPGMLALLAAIERRAAELRRRPGLWAAIRGHAAAALAQFTGSSAPIRHVMKDKGGYLLTLTILYFCYTQPGAATLAAFKKSLASAGVASRGRVAVLVEYMHAHGLLRSNDGSPRGTIMLGEQIEAFHIDGIRTLARLLPALAPEANSRDEVSVAVARAYVAVAAQSAAEVHGAFGVEPPALSLFGERNAGMLVAFSLLDQMPAGRPAGYATVSVAGLSKRLGVSRAHIVKMFEDAHREGFFVWDVEKRTVRFTEDLVEQFERFFAGLFALHEAYLHRARDLVETPA